MSPGFSKFTLLVSMTVLIGFFIIRDIHERKVESLGSTGLDMESSDVVPEDAVEMRIPVEGMTCMSCEMTIERVLGNMDGLYFAKASTEEKSVVAIYDPDRVSLSQIREEIEKAGYSPGEVVDK